MTKLKIVQEKDNPLLKRKDLVILVEHPEEGTPKTIDVANEIVKKYKSKLENIEICHIFTVKGVAESKVKARIWKEGSPKKVEVKEEKKPAEAPSAEQPKAKEPAPEEKAEEKPVEEEPEPEQPKPEEKEEPKNEEKPAEPEKQKEEKANGSNKEGDQK